jgi:hypothetical protein
MMAFPDFLAGGGEIGALMRAKGPIRCTGRLRRGLMPFKMAVSICLKKLTIIVLSSMG